MQSSAAPVREPEAPTAPVQMPAKIAEPKAKEAVSKPTTTSASDKSVAGKKAETPAAPERRSSRRSAGKKADETPESKTEPKRRSTRSTPSKEADTTTTAKRTTPVTSPRQKHPTQNLKTPTRRQQQQAEVAADATPKTATETLKSAEGNLPLVIYFYWIGSFCPYFGRVVCCQDRSFLI